MQINLLNRPRALSRIDQIYTLDYPSKLQSEEYINQVMKSLRAHLAFSIYSPSITNEQSA